MELLALPVLLLAFVPLSAQRDPFCPLERSENQCRARRNQYKCGAFFMSLAGQDEKLRWLGALPDMLHKPSVRQSRQLMHSMGNLHRKNFRVIPGFCNEILANARCYAIMEDVAKLSLDSCEYSMLNENADETLGNILCKKAARFAPGQNFQSFVSIGFYHSACGGNWTETHRKGLHLRMDEELCCKFEDGQSEYFRCDGSDFRRTCDTEQEQEDANETGAEQDRPFKPEGGVVRTQPRARGRKESLISTVVSSGGERDLTRVPRRLGESARVEAAAATSRSQENNQKTWRRLLKSQQESSKPKIRTFFVGKNGRVTRRLE